MSYDEIVELLKENSINKTDNLFSQAYNTKVKYLGKNVFLRGLIEFSNICKKDCFYCGIRKSNRNFTHYLMSEQEIVEHALWAYNKGYGSIVLQCGERNENLFIHMVTRLLERIRGLTSNKLRITLSCGEQTKNTYKTWFDAGAHRYLLRIESSNPAIYNSLHPTNHNYNRRLKCLFNLKEIGFQVGTGIMIGLPNQELTDLANDIIFFKSIQADMIGMGPFIPHPDTTLRQFISPLAQDKKSLYILSLKMIAITRILMPKINIAAATAYQALYPFGREKALLCGANIFMPNISDVKYRKNYKLYSDKPCVDENFDECLNCVESRITGIGESIKFYNWGDSIAFSERQSKII